MAGIERPCQFWADGQHCYSDTAWDFDSRIVAVRVEVVDQSPYGLNGRYARVKKCACGALVAQHRAPEEGKGG